MWYKYAVIFFGIMMISCSKPKKEIPETKTSVKVDSLGRIIYDLDVSEAPLHKIKAEKIENFFDNLHKSKQFNGCILAAEDGKIIYAAAKGYAVFSTKEVLNIHSSFHLASVSKQFTAMGIMMLKERGKLKYEDDIKKYVPELPYEGITIRHLLTHTSGVPNILNYIPYFIRFWDSSAVAKNSDVPYMLNKHKPSVQFKPGKRFSYNNTGYVLLALVIEKASGLSYNEFIEKNIFAPLQMDDSWVYTTSEKPLISNRAYGYGYYKNVYSLDEDDIRNGLVGEKGIYSSIIDLYKWDQALYSDVLVGDSTLKEAFQYASLQNEKKIYYGFGWRKSKKNEQVVYHFGHWRGFKTCIVRFPEDKKMIVILNNTGSKKIKSIAHHMVDILYSDKGEAPEF